MGLKIVITWDNEGPAVSDSKAFDYILDKVNKGETNIVVSTCAMLGAARVLHLRKEIEIDHVAYGDTIICINKDARLSRWPKEMCDQYDKMLEELCGW